MRARLLGIRKNVRFEDSRSGEVVEGTSLYVSHADPYVVGEIAEKMFVRSTLPIPCMTEIKPGMMLDLDLNTRGKIVDISICK